MKSMTGFGHGEVEGNGLKISIDIKSVNGRFLDITTKMPKSFLSLEDVIKNKIKESLTRGNIDVFINITREESKEDLIKLDKNICCQIYNAAEELYRESNIPNGITIKDLLKIDGVLSIEHKELESDELEPMVNEALTTAIRALGLMREKEGLNLKNDLLNNVTALETVVNQIKEEVPKSANAYREKLLNRITEALETVEVDDSKLINEVAFFVDKSDVNEEITRLYSHIEQFRNLLNESGAVGKQLEFISQEMTREINTTGSKSGSIEITNLVLEAKNINESIKEQIRNVE